MLKRYLSLFIITASIAVLYTGCDNTDATLTELWKVKAPAGEYINETYAFDNKNNMIAQGMKFDADGNEISSLFKITASGLTQWSVPVSNWGDIEIDKDDNVYFFNTSSSGSTYKYRIVKYSPAGAIIWQKNDIESEYSLSIDYYTTIKVLHSLDPAGNLLIMARSGSAPDQQGIIKINPAGNEVWRQNITAAPLRMVSDALGNAYIGCTVVVTQDEEYRLRVLKIDGANGTLLWDKICLTDVTYSEIYTAIPLTMLLDKANNLVIARNSRAAKIDKISPSGDLLWNYTFKPTDAGLGYNVDSIEVRFDGNNNAIISAVVAVQTGMIPMPTTDMAMYWPLGYQYCRLIKVDANGNKAWSKKVSNVMIMNGDTKGQLNVDRENNIYVFCNDNKLMKYTTAGKKLWTYEPEVTDVTMGQLSRWHVDSDLNLYWVLQCGAVEMVDYGYWITKYSQQ